jgi:hypothetical protein
MPAEKNAALESGAHYPNVRRLSAGPRRAEHYSWPAGKMPAERNAALESGAHYPNVRRLHFQTRNTL